MNDPLSDGQLWMKEGVFRLLSFRTEFLDLGEVAFLSNSKRTIEHLRVERSGWSGGFVGQTRSVMFLDLHLLFL